MTGFEGLDRPDGLARLTDEGLGAPTDSRIAAQRRRFVNATARAEPRWRAGRLALLAAAAAVVVVVAGGAWLGPRWASSGRPAPVASATIERDQWLEGGQNSGLVRLLDGATVRLSSQARARVQGLDGALPFVTLEGGRVEADLEPRLQKQWTFLAGAYRIQVLGTAFSVDYEPESGAIEVAVDRGRVRVTGGKLGSEAIVLGAGQRFRTDGVVVSFGADAPAEGATATSGVVGSASPSAAPRPAASLGWHVLFSRGDYAGALAAAEREGFDPLLGRLGAGELGDLADTARLAGSPARARQALMAVRSRYAGSAGAGRAAFLLGRMDGSPRWFETYLGEQPNGPYAAEAAGRLVVAYRDHGDLGRARNAAQRYLARHPSGPYAELARSLAGGDLPSR